MSRPRFRRRSGVLSETFTTTGRRLDDLAPELAKVIEQRRPPSARESPPPGADHGGGVPERVPAGKVFRNADLHDAAFVNGLTATMSNLDLSPSDQSTMWALGARDQRHFVDLIRRALTTDRGEAVTPSKAVGNYFEKVGWDHPVASVLREIVMDVYTDTVHSLVAKGEALRNGLFEPVALKSSFRKAIHTMENPRILDATTGKQIGGGQWVDRLDFRVNGNRQHLMIYGDLKVAGQAGELSSQVATRDPRLLAALALQHVTGALPVIEGRVNGQLVRIPLDAMVFPTDLDANALNRIGVRAATTAQTRYDAKIAKDEHGEPYVRMSVYCRTDLMYRVFVGLYREMGW
jgi:hypothetical protein